MIDQRRERRECVERLDLASRVLDAALTRAQRIEEPSLAYCIEEAMNAVETARSLALGQGPPLGD